MNHFVNRILGSAIGVALMAGTAATASAQQGDFHLPFEAKWAGTVLPPGDYHVSMPTDYLGRSIFLVRGAAGPSLILPLNSDPYGARTAAPGHDYLQLVKVDGEYFVTKYEAGSRAVTFFFKAPKPSRRVQLSEDVANLPVTGN